MPEYRAPNPSVSVGLSLGQHEGVEATSTASTSDAHAKPTPSSGSSRMLRTRSVPGSPDLFNSDSGGRLVGSHFSIKAPSTKTAKKDGIQTAPTIRTSV